MTSRHNTIMFRKFGTRGVFGTKKQPHADMDSLDVMGNPDSDRDSVLKIVREEPEILAYACDEFKDDYEVVLAAVDNKYAADAFNHASPRLRADRTIAETCVINDKYKKCIPYVDPSLLADPEFILAVLDARPYVFAFSTVPWTRDFLMDCVVAESSIVEDYLPDEYTADRQFALDVIAKGGHILQFLSDTLKDDREVVLAQLRAKNYGGALLEFASGRLQRDRDVVLEAVRTAPSLLENILLYVEYTPEERDQLLSDVEIMTTAVAQFGGAIRYASHSCRTNRTVVMTALTSKKPTTLYNIPYSMSMDPCIALCSTSKRPESTVDSLLTVLEAEVDACEVTCQHKLMYKHKVGRPFTADTVLALFDFKKCESKMSPLGLDALAALVNQCPSEKVIVEFACPIDFILRRTEGVLDDSVLDRFASWTAPTTTNKWLAHGVYDLVKERVGRLGDISEALPYIDRAVRRIHNNGVRNKCIERVDALAAKVHHPTRAYASIVHKRSFTEAFA